MVDFGKVGEREKKKKKTFSRIGGDKNGHLLNCIRR
jgi:hypothetical protein